MKDVPSNDRILPRKVKELAVEPLCVGIWPGLCLMIKILAIQGKNKGGPNLDVRLPKNSANQGINARHSLLSLFLAKADKWMCHPPNFNSRIGDFPSSTHVIPDGRDP